MAAVPDFSSEVTAYHSDENELFFEVDGPKKMKYCFQDSDLCPLDEGIELQISHQHFNKSFKQVVSLVVAVEKLKKELDPCTWAFQDGDLSAFFPFIFEEEPIICDTLDDKLVPDAPVPVRNCTLQDVQHKHLVLYDPMELKALHLNGENLNQQVVFSMSFVQGEKSNNKIPVALGLKGKNLYLSCVMKDDKPVLQLESVDGKQYPKKKMEKRFVFNKITSKSTVEFESAQFPNWYISTSQAEHMPVFLGKNNGQDIIDFSMGFMSS
ncbi:interleukin-1 beta [Octodon degus]|uniref:Multifunctional fusion protein n=1 Tax=Octodon degus TaxID=10160 RepID=A0A6P3FAQ7_OCTDE|nr:interleukin-1 beta [Octodon degus]